MRYPTIERRKVREELAKNKWKRCGSIYSKATSLEEYIIKRDTEGYHYRWNILDPYVRFFYVHQRPWLMPAAVLLLIVCYFGFELIGFWFCASFGTRNLNFQIVGLASTWICATILRLFVFAIVLISLICKHAKDMARADKNDMSPFH